MNEIEKAIQMLEPQVREAFLSAVADVRSSAQLVYIVKALEAGDIDRALTLARIEPAFFAPLDDAIRAAYLMGGRDALTGLPAIADPFSADLSFALTLVPHLPKLG